MDFFVLAGGRQQSVFRLELDRDLQGLLQRRFEQYSQEFLNEGLVAVPFERENFQPDET
jgi:hypothetical protein